MVMHCLSALTYLNNVENELILGPRIDALLSNGCERYACNLIAWCLRTDAFRDNLELLTVHLMSLHKARRDQEFHQQVVNTNLSSPFDIVSVG